MSGEGDERDGPAAGSSEDAPGWAAHGAPAAGRTDRSSGADHPLSGGLGSEFTGPSGSVDRPAGDADDSAADSTGDSDDDSPDRRKRKKRKKERDSWCDAWSCDALPCDSWPGGGRSGGGRSGGDGCGFDDCTFGCDLPGCHLFRLSTVLLVAAALVPGRGADWLVGALITGYRRFLTRFTPACPSTPSCSEYALHAVTTLGPRRGLTAAAARIRACGPLPR
ncbi:MAG TPA: membrane protein insertion efficiency factor YidD [Pseudonocardia sp.]|uniref:membrane protein insertion efficiency factor YidD n=1 Tax=Pseudonocardia sp. TaxID=60912 RepID=UPI002BA3526B|nr:membrane protein insertion efficiency factor YidD [Pseudonocardia sp.]HTF52229.1 membrane protein insertion efficiency factor YidD [Pseudonocardia sp.]